MNLHISFFKLKRIFSVLFNSNLATVMWLFGAICRHKSLIWVIMVVLSYSWLETFPSILLSSRVIGSEYIESRWSCIWSYDYLLRHISRLCLHWNVALWLSSAHWMGKLSEPCLVFHILVSLLMCGIPGLAVTQIQLCTLNKATRNGKATQKELGLWEISVQWIISLGPL